MHHESVGIVRKFTFFCLLCVLAFVFVASAAPSKSAPPEETEEKSEALTLPAANLTPTNLTTTTWGLFDPSTGEILTGTHVDDVYPIASVTKLFTGYVTLESKDKDTAVTVTRADVATEGKAGKLVAGEETTAYNLLYPLLLESSNDAAEAIKRSLGESYTDTLATTLASLKLTHTQLEDASGLSPENTSTVSDLAHFFAYVRGTTPHILDITQLRSYIGDTASYKNNNPGREISTFTGGKQGYTPEAKHTFVGTFTLPYSKQEIGIVILQSSNIRKDIQSLLAYSESFIGSGILAK